MCRGRRGYYREEKGNVEDGGTEGERRRAEKIGHKEWGEGREEKKRCREKKKRSRREDHIEAKKRSY